MCIHERVRPRHGVQFDRPAGRYAYGNQPAIAQWNLARFAETLLPLIDPDQEQAVALATEVLGHYHGSVRAVLARRDAGKARAPERGSWRPRARPVAVGLDAQTPGGFYQHIS